jgi:hypothetical protein
MKNKSNIITAIVVIAVLYTLTAFIKADIDFRRWPEHERGFLVGAIVIATLVTFMIKNLDDK